MDDPIRLFLPFLTVLSTRWREKAEVLKQIKLGSCRAKQIDVALSKPNMPVIEFYPLSLSLDALFGQKQEARPQSSRGVFRFGVRVIRRIFIFSGSRVPIGDVSATNPFFCTIQTARTVPVGVLELLGVYLSFSALCFVFVPATIVPESALIVNSDLATRGKTKIES